MANLFSVALIVCCALALMALEAFIPGVSFAGVAGVILFGIAAYLCGKAYGTAAAIVMLVAGGILSFLIMRLVLRSMKSGRLSKSGVFLNEPVNPAVKTAAHEGKIVPGSVGVAQSALRPAGIAEFDRQRVHVVSENGFVEKGERVVALQVERAQIIVRKLNEQE